MSRTRTPRRRIRTTLAVAAIGAAGAFAAPALSQPAMASTSQITAKPDGTWACVLILNKYPACVNNPFPLF